MEGHDREEKQSRSKQRDRYMEDGDEDHGRRKEEKKKKDSKALSSRQKAVPASVGQGSSSRYHHREVPPRFQHQKQGKHQKYPKSNQVSKKPMKEYNARWHPPQQTPPPSQQTLAQQSDSVWTDEEDGGWSRGIPEKGSGWSSVNTAITPSEDSSDTGVFHESQGMDSRDWDISESTAGGGRSGGDKGGGGVWLGVDGDSEPWRSTSPGQSSSKHSQAENWTISDNDDGSQSTGENAGQSAATGGEIPSDSSSNPAAGWGVGSNWKLPSDSEPIGEDLDRELASELDCCTGGSVDEQLCSGGKGTQEGASDWDDLETASHSSGEREPQTIIPVNTGQDGTPTRTPEQSPSVDEQLYHASISNDDEGSGAFERCSSSDSQQDQTEFSSKVEGKTGSVGRSGDREGRDSSMAWRSSRGSAGSTSSVNSIGSSSSWRGEGKGPRNYQSKGSSPRKSSRYDSRSNSQSGPLSGGSVGGVKGRKGKKASVVDLEDAIELLHNEPSGWGDLPSPKFHNEDNGTEFWGVPPADRKGRGTGKGGAIWGDPQLLGSECGGEEDPSGAIAAGWGQNGKETGSKVPPSGGGVVQWGTGGGGGGGGGAPETWNSIINKQQKDKVQNFTDNLKKLVDMGFPHPVSEQYLKANSNDIDATIGDLLAVNALRDEELGNSNGYTLQNSKNSKKVGKNSGFVGTTPTSMVPSNGTLTTGSTGTGIMPGLNPKDPLYQQLVALQAQMMSSSLQPPPLSGGPQTQAQVVQAQALQNQLLQMQLLQMQQRYMLSLGVFPGLPNLQNYQQLLTQQLGQMQLAKQQLTQQLQQLKSSGQTPSTHQQQQAITRLNYINQGISQINQQLVLLSQISSQQKDIAKSQDGKSTPSGVGSPQIGRSTPPIRNKVDSKALAPVPSRSQSASALSNMGSNEPSRSLSYGMQGLSLTGGPPPPNGSQSSARSVSRLQKIISGSSSSDNLAVMASKDEKQPPIMSTAVLSLPPTYSLPASAPSSVTAFSSAGNPVSFTIGSGTGTSTLSSGSASTPTTSFSTTSFPPAKSFDDIPEFKPGVPWQPRTQPTEPAQVYAKPVPQYPMPPFPLETKLGTGTIVGPFATQSTMKPNPPFSYAQSSLMTGSKAPTMTNMKYASRQQPSGSFYGTYPPHPQPIGSQTTMNKYATHPRDSRQLWGSQMPDSRGTTSSFGQMQNRSPYAGRSNPRSRHTAPFLGPFGSVGGNQAPLPATQSFGVGGLSSSSRKQQSRMPPQLPMQAPPNNFQFKSSFGGGGSSQVPMPQYQSRYGPVPMEGKKWGEFQGGMSRPWGTDELKPRWGQENHTWNLPQGDRKLHPRGPNASPHSTSMDPYPFAMGSAGLDSLAPGGCSMWSQVDFSHRSHGSMISPEPTFAEWQAGKKARLSVFRLPSNPPSAWLVIKNVTLQVDKASLRDVCSEYGQLQNCVINPALETALVRYCSKEDAMHAKAGLDKNPTICGVSVYVDFATSADLGSFEQPFTKTESTNSDMNMPNALEENAPSWYTEPIEDEAAKSAPPPIAEQDSSTLSKWDNSGLMFPPPPASGATSPVATDGIHSTSAGSGPVSLWSDGGFLPGLSTPWHNNIGSSRNQESGEDPVISGSPSLSTYLPNGLL